jgi:hypothetical protein
VSLQPHQQRVIAEKEALDVKREKLIGFIQSPEFDGITVQERSLLTRQLTAMDDYSAVLGERICAF